MLNLRTSWLRLRASAARRHSQLLLRGNSTKPEFLEIKVKIKILTFLPPTSPHTLIISPQFSHPCSFVEDAGNPEYLSLIQLFQRTTLFHRFLSYQFLSSHFARHPQSRNIPQIPPTDDIISDFLTSYRRNGARRYLLISGGRSRC